MAAIVALGLFAPGAAMFRRIMSKIDGVTVVFAREALRLAAMKLPIKTRTVVREDW